MSIAAPNYRYDSKAKVQRRHVLLAKTDSSSKKVKQQRSDVSTHSNGSLPSIKTKRQRLNPRRIQGNGLTASSFHQSSKYDYPMKFRSSNLNESDLLFREELFVSDSIRTANGGSRSSLISHYEPLDDPNLQRFFQSRLVVDVVRRTLNIDLDQRVSTKANKRTKINDRNDDYLRIVAKPSSGYSKLNGYDCIPPYAPARHRSFIKSSYRPSANSSLTSFPTTSSSCPSRQKTKLTPIVTSSPLRHLTASSVSEN